VITQTSDVRTLTASSLTSAWLAYPVGITLARKAFDIVVDAMAGWTRSSFCAEATCVEVAIVGDTVIMRDGKNPDKPHLVFSRDEWEAFRADISGGRFGVAR
jgi:hypothetical protein